MSASTATNLSSGTDLRRSTRVFNSVPLSVSGRNRFGNPFMESTSAVAMNCHGCLYPSRHEYKPGTWITLEVPDLMPHGKSRPVRAQVRFIRLPGNPHELYQVGVELETPADVWNLPAPPEDWSRFPRLQSVAKKAAPETVTQSEVRMSSETETLSVPAAAIPLTVSSAVGSVGLQDAPADRKDFAPSAAVKPVSVIADEFLKGMESKLDAKIEQEVHKAVNAALISKVGTALEEVAKAVESFTQTSLNQIEDRCGQHAQRLATAAAQEFRTRVQTDVAQANEQLRKQVEVFMAMAQETAQRLETSAQNVKPVLSEAQDFMHEASTELHERFAARLRETADRAGSDFDAEAAKLSDRQVGRLAEKAQEAASECLTRMEARATGARAQLETAASTALAEFHVTARAEIDRFVEEARRSVESTLTEQVKLTRTEWESRQGAWRDELTTTSQGEVDKFKRSLESIGMSAMSAAMTAVHEHSKSLLDALTTSVSGGTTTHAH